MKLCDINPFMRFAGLQPSVLSDTPFSRAYDHRLFYILDGSGKLIYDDTCVEIDTGTLLYFGPNKPYYFVGKIKIIVLNFDLSRARADQKKPMNPLNALNTFNEALLSKDTPPPELSDLIVVKNAFEAEPRLQSITAIKRRSRMPTPPPSSRSSFVTPFKTAMPKRASFPRSCKESRCIFSKITTSRFQILKYQTNSAITHIT